MSAPLAARRARLTDVLLGLVGGLATVSALAVLGGIVLDLVRLGWTSLSPAFLAGEVNDAGRSGGIGPVIASTLLILACCLAAAVPLGVGCAVWLSECVRRGSSAARAIAAGVDLLASVPSIVFGLFGMLLFCDALGLGFSILAGGLTLACMILPLLVRTTLSALGSLPADLRPSAAALGLTRTTALRRVLLPAAMPGIVAGITLGIARALSETAALLFTSGYATRWPEGIDVSGRALSVHIYALAMNVPSGSTNASASALVLLAAILTINFAATALSDRWLARIADR